MLEPDPDPLSTKKSSIRIKEMRILITGILRSIAKGDDKTKPNYTQKNHCRQQGCGFGSAKNECRSTALVGKSIGIKVVSTPSSSSLPAFGADVRLAQLDSHVPIQLVRLHMTLRPKGLVAQAAGKGFGAGMHPLMRLQLGAQPKGLSAGVAGEPTHLHVQLAVLPHGRGILEGFPACLARIQLHVARLKVGRSNVALQVAGMREDLVAEHTLEQPRR